MRVNGFQSLRVVYCFLPYPRKSACNSHRVLCKRKNINRLITPEKVVHRRNNDIINIDTLACLERMVASI